MKLRNKKTGKIVKLVGYVKTGNDRMFFRFEDDKGTYKKEYNSLAELNKDWEDYEELKDNDYWYIDDLGRIHFSSDAIDENEGHPNNWMIRKQFGNYFSSWYEAQQAMKKLKAWKRLKDRGFKIIGIRGIGKVIDFDIPRSYIVECKDDLLLLFGGNNESSN